MSQTERVAVPAATFPLDPADSIRWSKVIAPAVVTSPQTVITSHHAVFAGLLGMRLVTPLPPWMKLRFPGPADRMTP